MLIIYFFFFFKLRNSFGIVKIYIRDVYIILHIIYYTCHKIHLVRLRLIFMAPFYVEWSRTAQITIFATHTSIIYIYRYIVIHNIRRVDFLWTLRNLNTSISSNKPDSTKNDGIYTYYITYLVVKKKKKFPDRRPK